MFKITETDKGIELGLNNSEEHARTGVMLRAFTHTFSFDEWLEFTKEVVTLGDKMYLGTEPEPEPEIKSGLGSPPEPEEEPEIEEDLREDLKGQSDQIHDILEDVGPLTYEALGNMIEPPISPKRAARLVSQMIRDGVKLKREGKPRKVSIVK